MSRVFNICFTHKDRPYTALVSVSGSQNDSVRVISNNDNIQIVLPTGRLSFSIADVLQRAYASFENGSKNSIVYITENIFLQLMNTDW